MDKQTKEALKQMQAEMKHLQNLLAEQKPDQKPEPEPGSDPKAEAKPDPKSGVSYSIFQPPRGDGDAAFKTGTVSVSSAQLGKTADEAVAVLGYALSSPQKVGLLRALLGHSPESAAALGAAASLSTGSLYHHLRDLMHAGLIAQESRNRYGIAPRGRRVLLLLLALASE